ncbi:hypothetical protein R69888_00936 [Paraburkholderia haematera]|uniref:Uncharacterized protein n=1 Tax=Paraburkholderia haematera TaxID=2793077 RepID=A0ABN7KR91_9BURK|nr:hypothetical protein R69888_00936 [Paraburkholderia haematera]
MGRERLRVRTGMILGTPGLLQVSYWQSNAV